MLFWSFDLFTTFKFVCAAISANWKRVYHNVVWIKTSNYLITFIMESTTRRIRIDRAVLFDCTILQLVFALFNCLRRTDPSSANSNRFLPDFSLYRWFKRTGLSDIYSNVFQPESSLLVWLWGYICSSSSSIRYYSVNCLSFRRHNCKGTTYKICNSQNLRGSGWVDRNEKQKRECCIKIE